MRRGRDRREVRKGGREEKGRERGKKGVGGGEGGEGREIQ